MPLTRSQCEGAGRRNRRASVYVDKILNSAKPGDLLIELPTKVELVFNPWTAKAMDLVNPQSVPARADQVIK